MWSLLWMCYIWKERFFDIRDTGSLTVVCMCVWSRVANIYVNIMHTSHGIAFCKPRDTKALVRFFILSPTDDYCVCVNIYSSARRKAMAPSPRALCAYQVWKQKKKVSIYIYINWRVRKRDLLLSMCFFFVFCHVDIMSSCVLTGAALLFIVFVCLLFRSLAQTFVSLSFCALSFMRV